MADKVISSVRGEFGGSRIAGGVYSADLWSDGVVIAAAWTMEQEEIAGTIYGFRGTITKATYSRKWRLESVDGRWIDDFGTRGMALERAAQEARMEAFRALNIAEAVR